MIKMTKSQISKNVAIVVGQKKKLMQFVNVKKLGIKCLILLTLIVTQFADHIIPANDDSRNSIKYVLNKLIRIRLAHKLRQKMNQNYVKHIILITHNFITQI
jgi:ribosomal protein S2